MKNRKRCKTYCETTSCVEVNSGDHMRSLPNWLVEREFMNELNWKDCRCITLLLNSECKIMDSSFLSGSLRVLLVLIAIAVSFSASDLPHRTNKLQSTADKNRGIDISSPRFKLYSNCSITMNLIHYRN